MPRVASPSTRRRDLNGETIRAEALRRVAAYSVQRRKCPVQANRILHAVRRGAGQVRHREVARAVPTEFGTDQSEQRGVILYREQRTICRNHITGRIVSIDRQDYVADGAGQWILKIMYERKVVAQNRGKIGQHLRNRAGRPWNSLRPSRTGRSLRTRRALHAL